MTYRDEFPKFNPANMPPIPPEWEDVSWHNDACPSFQTGDFLIYVDYANPADREIENHPRFAVLRDMGENFDVVIESDDWNAVLAVIAAAKI
jgi:hypothetical protein